MFNTYKPGVMAPQLVRFSYLFILGMTIYDAYSVYSLQKAFHSGLVYLSDYDLNLILVSDYKLLPDPNNPF